MVSLTEGQKAYLSPEAATFLTNLRHPPLPSITSKFLTMPSRVESLRETISANAAPGEAKLIEQHSLQIQRVEIAGVSVVVIEPPVIKATMKNRIMFNIFGGGFTVGSPRDRAALLTAAELGVRVYSPEYTRAPEARYPVARDQCMAVYEALIGLNTKYDEIYRDGSDTPNTGNLISGSNTGFILPSGHGPFDPADIFAQGSSSGGQILLSMLCKLHEQGKPLPMAGLHLCTPAADLSGAGNSVVSNGVGRDVFPASFLWSMAAQNYPPLTNDNNNNNNNNNNNTSSAMSLSSPSPDLERSEKPFDERDPFYSPLYYDGYDGKSFPRTVITVGTRDVLLSTGVRLYWKLHGGGVDVELFVFEGMWHGFNWDQSVPEARHAREVVFGFLEGAGGTAGVKGKT